MLRIISSYGILLILSFHVTLHAQDGTIDKTIEWILDNQIDQNNEIDVAQLQNELEVLTQKPININSEDLQILVHVGLISQSQFNAVQEHIKDFGPIKSIEEIQLIEEFEVEHIRLLKSYLRTNNFAEKVSVTKELKETKNDLTFHYNQLLQKRKGFSGEEKYYQGQPSRIMIKFKTQFYSKWRIGLNFEKDSGEKFAWDWQSNRRGFDHSSLYIEYKSKKTLRRLLIGDYQVRLGQGLSFWKGFAFRKSSNSIGIRKVAQELRAHTGMDEINFLRGLSMELAFKSFRFISYFSYKKIDAILSESNSGNISSIQSSGLHRSIREISSKAKANEAILGGYLSYSLASLKVGTSFTYQELNSNLSGRYSLINHFNFNGRKNHSLGIDADYRFKNGHIFFELSRSMNSSIAYLVGMVLSPDRKFSFAGYYRNFPKDYQAISSNAFGESSINQNEDGFYLGIEYSPKHKMHFNAYFDLFRFSWISTTSSGSDLMLASIIPISSSFKITMRYRYLTNRLDDYSVSTRHKLRIQNDHILSPSFQFRYRLSFHNFQSDFKLNGYLFFLDLIYQNPNSPISISCRYALFNTDSYETRIYAYERDLYFTYSVRPYYYKGQKFYLNFKWRLKRYFTFLFRFSQTSFPYRQQIGSSQDLIEGNKKSEIAFQIRIRW